ncbi:MAG: efflux RND transporter periplasmic adaptor subunit [Parashewanella sp.]
MKYLPQMSLVFLSIFLLVACGKEEAEFKTKAVIQPVKLMTISSLANRSSRSFAAKVAANKQAALSFRMAGVLQKRPPLEGSKVVKGQLLAQLETKDAKNNLLNREADYDLAQSNFKRTQRLLNQKLISPAEFDASKAQLKSAKAALSIAKDKLGYTNLYAPFDGIVAKVATENFQVIGANQTVLTLQKNDTVDLEVQIPESLVAKYLANEHYKSIKSTAEFVGSDTKSYPVTLKEFATQVTPGTQAYEVVFSLPQPKDIALLPGMTAVINFMLPQSDAEMRYVVIPLSAVEKRDEDGKSLVWIYKNGRVEQRQVSIGQITANGIEITKGVKAGEQVVIAGIHKLHQDQKVKPLEWERGV